MGASSTTCEAQNMVSRSTTYEIQNMRSSSTICELIIWDQNRRFAKLRIWDKYQIGDLQNSEYGIKFDDTRISEYGIWDQVWRLWYQAVGSIFTICEALTMGSKYDNLWNLGCRINIDDLWNSKYGIKFNELLMFWCGQILADYEVLQMSQKIYHWLNN